MRSGDVYRPNQSGPVRRKIVSLPDDFHEALNFAVMYQLHKQQENLDRLKAIGLGVTSSINTSTKKSKKPALFESHAKTKPRPSYEKYEKPEIKYRTVDRVQPPVQKQYCFTRQPQRQYQHENNRQLSQFISQLSTPTILYSKIDEPGYDQPQPLRTNKPKELFEEERRSYDFNSLNIRNPHYKEQYPAHQEYPRQEMLRLRQEQSNQYYQPQSTRPEQIRRQEVPKYNQANTPIKYNTQPQKYQYRQPEYDSAKPVEKPNNLPSHIDSQTATLPAFGKSGIKVYDFTKSKKVDAAGIDTESMYESPSRPFYHPSPTKSSSNISKKKPHSHYTKGDSKDSSSQKSEQEVEEEQHYHHTSTKQKKSNAPPPSHEQVQKQKDKQKQKYKPQPQTYSKYRQSVELEEKAAGSKKHSPSPTPRSQSPKPSSVLTQKHLVPRIPYNKTDDRICKFSSEKSFEERERYFDSETQQQLSALQSSKTVRQLNINLSQYVPYLPESEEESSEQYQTHHRAKVPAKTRLK